MIAAVLLVIMLTTPDGKTHLVVEEQRDRAECRIAKAQAHAALLADHGYKLVSADCMPQGGAK